MRPDPAPVRASGGVTLIEALRGRWRLVLGLFLLGLMLSVAQSFLHPEPPVAIARVLIEVQPLDGSAGITLDTVLATEREIARSRRVAERAGLDLKGRASLSPAAVDALRESLEVRLIEGTSVLQFRYADTDPAQAVQRVNALARAYLDEAALRAAGSETAVRMEVRRTLLESAERALAPGSGRLIVLGAALAAVLAALAAWAAERSDARIRRPQALTQAGLPGVLGRLPPAAAVQPVRGSGGRVAAQPVPLMPASATTAAAPPPLGQMLVSAGLLHPPEVERILAWSRQEGLRFGEAAVAQRLVTPEQVERVLAAQFGVTVLPPGASAVSPEVIAAYAVQHPLVAELHRIRGRIRALQEVQGARPGPCGFAVVSPGRAEGRSFLAANLAVVCAQGGQRTLLIDADLRHGRQHRLFGLSNTSGLSSLLNRSLQPGWLQTVPGLPQLSLLPCGPLAPNPALLLTRDHFDPLLAALAQSYDLLIFDTPCTTQEPDALLIAQRIGAALTLSRVGQTRQTALREWAQEAKQAGVVLLGGVLNDA